MLAKYLQTQQDTFDQMRRRQHQLQQRAELEQQRCDLLQQHIAGLETNQQMVCSLGLQNLSGLKQLLHTMVCEQDGRSVEATQELQAQRQVCHKQASHNLALEQLLQRQQQQQQLREMRKEQRQQDELALQLFMRRP